MLDNRKKENGSIRYTVVGERRYSPELGAYRSYGIAAIQAHQYRWAAYVPDVSVIRAFVSWLAERCMGGQLSLIHLQAVVMDALGL